MRSTSNPPASRKCPQSPLPRPRPARPGAYGRPCPAGPRSSGCWSRRSARPARADPGFMPRHIEQPAARHSNPASVKIAVQPFLLRLGFDPHRARHDHRAHAVRALSGLRRRAAASAQILDSAVRAGADEDRVDRDLAHRGARLEIHVRQRPRRCLARCGSSNWSGIGHRAVDRDDLARIRAPRNMRRDLRAVERRPRGRTSRRHRSAASANHRARCSHCSLSARAGAPRRRRRSCRPARSCPALAPASIDILQIVIRPSIESARMVEPRYSMIEPMPPPVPILPMIARMMSLAVEPAGNSPSTRDRHRLRPHLRQRLRGEHMLDFAGADPERQRAERAVGRGVASRRRRSSCRAASALLGTDHVDDALPRIAHRMQADPELGAVLRQH